MSNYVLNGTGALIQVTPWLLIPQPLLVNKTNTTIAIEIIFEDIQIYEPVTDVSVKVKIEILKVIFY